MIRVNLGNVVDKAYKPGDMKAAYRINERKPYVWFILFIEIRNKGYC